MARALSDVYIPLRIAVEIRQRRCHEGDSWWAFGAIIQVSVGVLTCLPKTIWMNQPMVMSEKIRLRPSSRNAPTSTINFGCRRTLCLTFSHPVSIQQTVSFKRAGAERTRPPRIPQAEAVTVPAGAEVGTAPAVAPEMAAADPVAAALAVAVLGMEAPEMTEARMTMGKMATILATAPVVRTAEIPPAIIRKAAARDRERTAALTAALMCLAKRQPRA